MRGETDVVCLFCKDRLKEAAAAVFLPTEQGQRKGGAGAGGGGASWDGVAERWVESGVLCRV